MFVVCCCHQSINIIFHHWKFATLCLEWRPLAVHSKIPFKVKIGSWHLACHWWQKVSISLVPSVFLIFGRDFFKEAKSKGPHRQSCLASMRFKICLVKNVVLESQIHDDSWFMSWIVSATDEAVEVAVQQGQVILEDEPSMVAAFSLDMAKLILGWKVATEVLRSTMNL